MDLDPTAAEPMAEVPPEPPVLASGRPDPPAPASGPPEPPTPAIGPPEPPVSPSGPPGLRIADGLALVVLFVGVSMLPTLFSGLMRRTIGFGIGRGWQVVLVELIAGAALIPLGLRWSGLRFREACPMPPYPARLLPGVVVGSMGLAVVLGELESWLPGVEKFGDVIRDVLGSSGVLPAVLASCIAAPIVEEMLCRGVMLRGLMVRRGVGRAIVDSAVLFAVMHLNPWQGAIALPLGLAYAWLTLRTGSVLTSMLAHAIHNTMAAVFVVPALHRLERAGHVSHMPAFILVPAACAAAAGCALLWWQLRDAAPDAAVAPATPGAPDAPAVADTPPVLPGMPSASGAARLTQSILATVAVLIVGVAITIWSGELGTDAAMRSAEHAAGRRPSYAETYRLSGCYNLELPGDVASRLLPGAGSTLPVRLTMRRYRGAASQEYVVETLPGAATSAEAVYWIPKVGGEVRVIAPTRGAVLRLTRHGRDLAGEARTYPQGARQATIAGPARARRVACPADTTQAPTK